MIYLGNLSLTAPGKEGEFHFQPVVNNDSVHANSEFDVNSLSSVDYVNGFTAGVENAVSNYQSSAAALEIDVTGNQTTVSARFKDGGKATAQYEVNVYLIVEELVVITIEEGI
jgi:hypothetical protein